MKASEHRFDGSEEIEEILPVVRAFVDEALLPLEELFLKGSFETLAPQLEAVRDTVREMGLFTPQLHRKDAGKGMRLSDFGQLSEILGRTPIGHYAFNCQAPDAGNMELLLEHGSPTQRETYLDPLVAGQHRSCFSMTERNNPGSNPVWMDTTAVKEGEEWVINGEKWFTSSADGAAFAIVMAITDPDAPRHARASMFIVPCDNPGFELVRRIPVMGHPGSGYATHCEIRYHNCRIPADNLLGHVGAGFMMAQARLGPGRIHHCMRWIGIAQRAFEMMCTRAAKREISPGKPLGTRQLIQGFIADSKVEIRASRLMVLETAAHIEAQGSMAARVEISEIKFYVAGMLQRVLDRAIQVHGALGMTDDIPLAYWFRHERAALIYDGADEVHKGVVARSILKAHGMVK